jgi:hypothetical protein
MAFKLKRSAVAGKVPTPTQLALGELAANTHDGRLFLKRDDGTETIIEVGAQWGAFTASASGTVLTISYQGTPLFQLDSSGNLTVAGDITAFGDL